MANLLKTITLRGICLGLVLVSLIPWLGFAQTRTRFVGDVEAKKIKVERLEVDTLQFNDAVLTQKSTDKNFYFILTISVLYGFTQIYIMRQIDEIKKTKTKKRKT